MRLIKNSFITALCLMASGLLESGEKSVFNENEDDGSNGLIVQKQLKCTISTCFDMGNTCCKECEIKTCRYKCNYADKEICEHQSL